MVIVLVVGAFLRPLPSVVLASDLLTDDGVGHVGEPEDETADVRDMGDTSARSATGKVKELEETKDNHEVFRRDGKEKVDQDRSVGEEPSEGEEETVDGSGCPNDGESLVRTREHGTDSGTNATEEEIEQKPSGSPQVLQLSPKHPEGEQVEQDMSETGVEKNVRPQLPEVEPLPDKIRDQAEVDDEEVTHPFLEEEDRTHDDHQLLDDRGETVPEGEAISVGGHSDPSRFGEAGVEEASNVNDISGRTFLS